MSAMYFVLVSLVLVIALAGAYIWSLQGRIDALHDRLFIESAASVTRESAALQRGQDLADQMMEQVSSAVAKQMVLMQDSVKTAWSPQQPIPQTPNLLPGVEQIMRKYGLGGNGGYNLPVPAGIDEHDYHHDPSDRFLPGEDGPPHMGAAMMPDSGLDSDEPFGVPGLKAAY